MSIAFANVAKSMFSTQPYNQYQDSIHHFHSFHTHFHLICPLHPFFLMRPNWPKHFDWYLKFTIANVIISNDSFWCVENTVSIVQITGFHHQIDRQVAQKKKEWKGHHSPFGTKSSNMMTNDSRRLCRFGERRGTHTHTHTPIDQKIKHHIPWMFVIQSCHSGQSPFQPKLLRLKNRVKSLNAYYFRFEHWKKKEENWMRERIS